MIGSPLKIVDAIRVTLSDRVLPQLDAGTWLAGDVRSSIALLTYLEDVLTHGLDTMTQANAAMTGFLRDAAAAPGLPDAVRGQMTDAVAQAQAETAERADLVGLEETGRTLKAALSAFIAARDAQGIVDAGLQEKLRACLRELAHQEQILAKRTGGMSPF